MPFPLSRRSLQLVFWILALVLAALIYAIPPAVVPIAGVARADIGRFMLFLAIGASLIPAAVHLYDRFPLTATDWRAGLAAHLLAGAAAAGIALAAQFIVANGLHAPAPRSIQDQPALHAFGLWWVAVAVLWGYRGFRAAEEAEALQQLSLDLVRVAPEGKGPAGTRRNRFRVRSRGRHIDVPVQEVHWIQASGKQVILHLRDRSFRLDESMRSLEKTLDPDFFVRVHRSRMVNLDRIAEIRPWPHGDHRIVLQDGTVVNYSRRYRHRLEHPQGETAKA